MNRALTRRRALAWTATAASFAAAPALVRAAGDLRIVVPYPAGGSPDNSARIASAEAARELGVSVIVENRPGASGLLGARAVSQGQADGSTLVYVSSGHVTLAAINPRFDLLKELRPVVRVSASPFVAVVSAQSRHRTMAELVAAVQAQPGRVTYGSAGQGSPAHMAVEFLHEATGNFQGLHVPFKGAVESINAILGGQIDFTIGVLGAAVPHINAGRLRALGMTTPQRLPLLPEVPTIAEATRSNYQFMAWGGFMMHPATPDAAVARLEQALRRGAQSRAYATFLQNSGAEPWLSESPAAFGEQLRRDLEIETQVVRRLNLRQG